MQVGRVRCLICLLAAARSTDLYSQQLHSGQDYTRLQPTYAIWLLSDGLIQEAPGYIHDYWLRDRQGRLLLRSCLKTNLLIVGAALTAIGGSAIAAKAAPTYNPLI